MKIIMPVWILDQETLNLTESALRSFDEKKDMVIIDNGSLIGGGLLRSFADTYVRNNVNLGYAKAMNQGFRLFQKEDYFVFAQNDTMVSQNWKEVALDILKDEKVGSVHFRMISYNEPFSFGNDIWKEGKERWSHSSFCVVRNLQEFDENYLNSYDDWDFWYRLRKLGYKTAYTNKVCFQHLDSYTQQKNPNRNENDLKNREYFKKKHGEYPEPIFERMYPDQMNIPWKPFP